MTELAAEKVSQRVRDIFNKGFTAVERGNLDYAIDLLFSCVQAEPSFLQARKYLRAAEVQRFKKKGGGALAHHIAFITGLPLYLVAMSKIRKDPAGALVAVEKLLRQDPLHPRFVHLLAAASSAAGIPEAGVQTLEVAREHFPHDVEILRELGVRYQEVGNTRCARECFEKLCEFRPNDPEAVRMLKNAMALDSMQKDGWTEAAEKGGTFRDIIKDTKEAVLLEQKEKAFKSDKDMDDLIADLTEKIKKEPQNINYYRALARYYGQRTMFAEAVATVEKAREISPGDPELDNLRSNLFVQRFDFEIARLKEAGDAAAVEAKTLERDQFVFDDLHERVKRYPNDLKLRFDLGVMLLENDYLNEAIQQFQLSQRNPKLRVRSLYYLGICFEKKGQNDMAVEQLELANSELPIMDDTKKDVLYSLGRITEVMGDPARALAYFKQIYQVDIGYRDVATKIEQLYKT